MEEKRVLLSHGDGGGLTHDLIESLFLRHLSNQVLGMEDDSGILPLSGGKWQEISPARLPLEGLDGMQMAFSTDSFVVDPLFFPGGDIGKLSIYGTLNDLWVSGAVPLFMSAAFIIEEGTSFEELETIVKSMKEALSSSNVFLVTADTKVVPKGKGDRVFISTSGVGFIPKERSMERRARPGQKVLVSGPIAEHGITIMAARMGIEAKGLASDCGPVGPDVEKLFAAGLRIGIMRDPTRGGLATALKEIAQASSCDILLDENEIPIKPQVKEVCDLLGLDPLYLACEGRVVATVDGANGVFPPGWSCIGKVTRGKGDVFLKTMYGGTRRLGLLEGTPLPRIC